MGLAVRTTPLRPNASRRQWAAGGLGKQWHSLDQGLRSPSSVTGHRDPALLSPSPGPCCEVECMHPGLPKLKASLSHSLDLQLHNP